MDGSEKPLGLSIYGLIDRPSIESLYRPSTIDLPSLVRCRSVSNGGRKQARLVYLVGMSIRSLAAENIAREGVREPTLGRDGSPARHDPCVFFKERLTCS